MKELDFSKLSGLLPGIVTDAETGRVLMLGFLNEAAWRQSIETGFVTFWSRSREKLWMKGETSGHRLRIEEIRADCDWDSVEFRVTPLGPGVCHEGFASCFSWRWSPREGGWEQAEKRAFDPTEVYVP